MRVVGEARRFLLAPVIATPMKALTPSHVKGFLFKPLDVQSAAPAQIASRAIRVARHTASIPPPPDHAHLRARSQPLRAFIEERIERHETLPDRRRVRCHASRFDERNITTSR